MKKLKAAKPRNMRRNCPFGRVITKTKKWKWKAIEFYRKRFQFGIWIRCSRAVRSHMIGTVDWDQTDDNFKNKLSLKFEMRSSAVRSKINGIDHATSRLHPTSVSNLRKKEKRHLSRPSSTVSSNAFQQTHRSASRLTQRQISTVYRSSSGNVT